MLSPVQVLAVYIFICDIFGELCVVRVALGVAVGVVDVGIVSR